MDKKIVFFDIDGTLLDHEKKLPDSTKTAIQELKENGVFVAIATGRAPFMFEPLRKELGIDTYVSFNGQYVVFENEVIYQNPMDSNQLQKIKEDASKTDETPIVFMNEKTMKSSVDHSRRIAEALGSLKFPHPESDHRFHETHQIYQALLFCTKEEEERFLDKYEKFQFIRWHEFSTDVLPKGGSKAEGIKKVMERIGFDIEDVYAFGDGLNDIEMLKEVGHGVAMGNAHQAVKDIADYVTKDVAEDGILHGLKEFGLL
ncbi:Cof-type HAD-IIB family hydrolase [Bacillus massiliglaciei]|uniref:Cof-type HAD-IIB family hydrolase n=1 Tax=Bacillus massiliglaciei TaxID=1816693 RepID=UPI000AA54374|nr:Cof-type HAD-IIB family hydrolase [Bacillus massiliglaciei]